MKLEFLNISLCLLFIPFFTVAEKRHIDPTGTYILSRMSKVKNIELTYEGSFCEVFVTLIEKNRIVVKLSAVSGYPKYDSISVADTLNFKGKTAIYTVGENEDYKLKFRFLSKGMILKEIVGNSYNDHVFSKGIEINGFYKKNNSAIPDFR